MCLCNIQLEQIVHSIPHIFPDYFFWPPSTENLAIIYLLISNHWSLSLTSLTPWVWHVMAPCEARMWHGVITIPHYLSFWDKEESQVLVLAPAPAQATPRPARGESWVLHSHQPVVNIFSLQIYYAINKNKNSKKILTGTACLLVSLSLQLTIN